MDQKLRKLMLSECRCVTYIPAEQKDSVVEENLAKAVTANENLMSLGYSLKPADIARLSASPSLDTLYKDVKKLVGNVKTQPMYPGFPTQVMEISEAQFRIHQLMHYFSTYGLEELFGEKVSKGWLPNDMEPEIKGKGKKRKKADKNLLKMKVLELLEEDQAAKILAKRILRRRERMTLPERELVRLALVEIAPEELEQFEVPFKENLADIFPTVIENCPKEQAFQILHALCKHTGDVLRCTYLVLKECKFHLRTSQKRFLVQLLESYPAVDFKSNLILSLKKAQKSLLVLKHLDYNLYSRSEEHKEAVRALRDGELHSWEGQAKYLLTNHKDGALDFIAARPGMMLRMVAWLIRLGYSVEEIQEKLMPSAGKLSTQTLVTTLQYFGKQQLCESKIDYWKKELVAETEREPAGEKMKALLHKVEELQESLPKEIENVYTVFEAVLSEKLRQAETPLKEKKVYLDLEEYNLAYSALLCNEKSEEGGYIRSGIAYRIPEEVKRLRFFVYWNDKERVDVDLHASATSQSGENITIGWNSDFRSIGIVSSGDITHSDAAEYIDVDLTAPLKQVSFNINLYSGKNFFGEIETCYVGMMAVDQIGLEIQLYNPANCFFTHELRGKYSRMNYGFVDVEHRCLVFDGRMYDGGYYDMLQHIENRFNLKTYLDCLFESQKVVLTQEKEEADIILKMGKTEKENEISLVDENFFL